MSARVIIDLALLARRVRGRHARRRRCWARRNLGTALTFGQIAFAVALVYVLLRR